MVALAAVAALDSFVWTNTYYPEGFPGRVRRGPRSDIASRTIRPSPDSDHPISSDVDGRGVDDVEPRVTAVHDVDEDDGAAHHGEDAAQDLTEDSDAVEDEATATARWFVTFALDGRFGEAHRQAAQAGLAVAIEHGFDDDAKRVAESLVVFLLPEHR